MLHTGNGRGLEHREGLVSVTWNKDGGGGGVDAEDGDDGGGNGDNGQ